MGKQSGIRHENKGTLFKAFYYIATYLLVVFWAGFFSGTRSALFTFAWSVVLYNNTGHLWVVALETMEFTPTCVGNVIAGAHRKRILLW